MNRIFTIIFILLCNCSLVAQCGFDIDVLIPDESSQNFVFNVSGLANDNLASPTQGICGVTLHFNHNSIGDWEVVLTSPSGQMVTLIGPVGLFADSEMTNWDITFVPCGDLADPDLGFLQIWDSDQSWGSDNSYFGSYYPNIGCLEDFNAGSANGNWTLYISDNNSIDEGNLLDFSLEFCDISAGQECMLCDADGGEITGAARSGCEGDPVLIQNFIPSFTNGMPDAGLYDYTYIIVEGNSIVSLSNPADLTALLPGNYSIYGLSYLRADNGLIPSIGSLFSDVIDNLASSSPDFCGSLSDNSQIVDVYDIPDATVLFDTICIGDTYINGDSIFTTPGIRNILFETVNGCDSVVVSNLAVTNVAPQIIAPLELDCVNTEATLFFSGIPLTSLDFINWFNTTATVQINDQISIIVDEPGDYFAAYSFRGCIDTISWTLGDANLPALTVVTDTITCTNRIGQIIAQSDVNVSYDWTFNNLSYSSSPSPNVTEAGIYRVTIEDINGCRNVGSVIVVVDTIAPPVGIQGGSLSCTTTDVTLVVTTQSGSTALWNGPGTFNSSSLAPQVSVPGLYTVVVTGPNGCQTTQSVLVDDTARPFDLVFDMDTITCANPIADISFTSALGTVMAVWTSPNNDVFNGTSQMLDEGGIYQLQVTSIDQCVLDTMVEIFVDTIRPVLNILGDTELNCLNESQLLSATVDGSLSVIDWIAPDLSIISSSNIIVSQPGNYIGRTVSPNGCEDVDSIIITAGADLPIPTVIIDTFDCETDTIILMAENIPGYGYQWSQNTMSLGNMASQQIVDTGYYFLDYTDDSGCQARYSYYIPVNLSIEPATLLGRDTINCMDSVLDLAPTTFNQVRSFNWTRNNAQFSTDSLIEIKTEGIYRLNIEYSTLCSEQLTSRIAMDTISPDLSIGPIDTLTCAETFIDLTAQSLDDVDFEWYFGDVFFVDQDVLSVSVPGEYRAVATADNFCVSELNAIVPQDTMAPVFMIAGDTINCANSKVELIVPNPEIDWLINWVGPLAFVSDRFDVIVRDTGIYTASVVGRNGCESDQSFTVLGDFILPVSSAIGGSLSCTDTTLQLNGTTETLNSVLRWFGPMGFSSDDPMVVVRDTGSYVLLTTASNGCTTRDTVHVDDMPPFPDSQIMLDLWDCSTTELTLNASSLDTGVVFDWVGPDGFIFSGSSPVITSFGEYQITYTGSNGCMTRIDTFIPTDTIHPIAEIYSDQVYRCEQRQINLLGDGSNQGTEYSYLWTSENGSILTDSSLINVLIGDTALYMLQVINDRNHCRDTAVFNVIETDSDLLEVDFSTVDYGCLSGYNGQFIINQVVGEGLPIMYSYDEEPFVLNESLNNLLPGTYSMTLRDTFGCLLDTSFMIFDSAYLNIVTRPDTTIELGDSVIIDLTFSDSMNQNDVFFNWWPNLSISCDTCQLPVVMPLVTTTYCVDVTSLSGCDTTACVTIKVDEVNRVFVPSAFTPNGDNLNDRLVPMTSKDISEVRLFQIFDRWGTLLHMERNVLPDQLLGWDGNFNGDVLEPQVVVYRLQYMTLSNKIKEQSGDITLLR